MSWPMKNGIIVDIENELLVWQYLKSNANLNNKDKVLITDNPLNPHANKFLIAEKFFEDIEVEELMFLPPSVLSLFNKGLQSGLVVDIGHGQTHVLPVFDH